ncbi:TIGR02391 family protein [Gordonia sp. PP30]|uniref:TIGR02391 family protein n=1 Tax=Gordonia sp. PP30 TaxID=2935861 RepID=UPI0020004045|nr:TIGR02391 family protein [Gordonia sp. PP30]UQE75115.1 TIGR02391 family protein [Gordonia sp. PP30]
MTIPVPSFEPGTIEAVARAVGDLYTGTELTQLLADARLPDPFGEGTTKWRRLDASLRQKQNEKGDGRAVIGLIHAAMTPDRTLSRRAQAAVARDELTQALSLSGFQVNEKGRVVTAKRATTDSEAAARSTRLRNFLAERGAHDEVLRHCRAELPRDDYYEAVFEAIKGLGDRLRRLSGLDLDGSKLVQQALGGKTPTIRLNVLSTETQRNEQRGIALLAEGLFAAFRNPSAHEPKIKWQMSEQDALDVLGTASMVHRRLDSAVRAS